MRFSYQARNQTGQVKQGFVVAADQTKAEQLLTDNGLIIINLKVQRDSILERFRFLNFFNRHVSYKDVVLLSRQLSTLVSARVPILQSLRILESQITNKRLEEVIRDMITSVENGES